MMSLNESVDNIQDPQMRDVLVLLASSLDVLQEAHKRNEVYRKLETIYYNPNKNVTGYRHFYSDIFIILMKIKNGEYKGTDIDTLAVNIKFIYENYADYKKETGSKVDIGNNIRKLYDHVSLDILRIQYSEQLYRKTAGIEALTDLRNRSILAEKKIENIEKLEKRIKSMKKTLGAIQKQYITILGIFSSVVITFVAGMTFSTSVLGNIDKASIYRLVFIISLVGLGFFNLVYLLLTFIHRVANEDTKSESKNVLNIADVNKVIFAIMVIDFLAWLIYWVRFGDLPILRGICS
nr:hypothetical protein [uncultured Selenomonas sp.]